MCRNLLLIVLSFITTLLFIITLVYYAIFSTVATPRFYIGILRDLDAYSRITEAGRGQADFQFEKLTSPQGEEASEEEKQGDEQTDQFRQELSKGIADNIINDILSEELLQDTVESNIYNFFDYLNSNDPDLTINLPVTKIRDYLGNNIYDFFDAMIEEGVKNYDTCTPEQEAQFDPETFKIDLENLPDCLPSFVDEDELKDQFYEQVDLDEQLDTFLNDNEFQDLKDETTLRELITVLQNLSKENKNNDEGPKADEIMNQLETFRGYFHQAKLALILAFVVVGILMLVILLLNYNQWVNALSWIGWIWIVAGGLLLISALTSIFLLNDLVPRLIEERINAQVEPDVQEYVQEYIEVARQTAVNIVSAPFRRLAWTTGIATFLGIVMLTAKGILKKRAGQKIESTSTKEVPANKK